MQIFHLFHEKDGGLYQVALSTEQWDILNAVLLSITKDKIPVLAEKFCDIEVKETKKEVER